MINLSKKIILTIFSGILILTGIFCFSNMDKISGHCSSDMHSSVLCGDIIEHGTLINTSLVTLIFILLVALINFTRVEKKLILIKIIVKNVTFRYGDENSDPLTELFSRGILNPKKP